MRTSDVVLKVLVSGRLKDNNKILVSVKTLC